MSIVLSPFMSTILGLEAAAVESPGTEVTTKIQDANGNAHTVGCRVAIGQAHKYRGAIVRTYTLDGKRTTLPLIQDQLERA